MFIHGVPVTGPWSLCWAIASVFAAILIISITVRIILRIARGECCRRFCAEQSDASAAARTILDERYAKGEIDDEEYRRKKEILRQ